MITAAPVKRMTETVTVFDMTLGVNFEGLKAVTLNI